MMAEMYPPMVSLAAHAHGAVEETFVGVPDGHAAGYSNSALLADVYMIGPVAIVATDERRARQRGIVKGGVNAVTEHADPAGHLRRTLPKQRAAANSIGSAHDWK